MRLLLALFLLGPLFAQATPRVDIAITVVPGQNAISLREARAAMREARQIFASELGVNLVLVSSRIRRAPKSNALMSLQSTDELLYYWSKRFWKKHIGGVLNLAILPPLNDRGTFYYAGRAGGFCALYDGFAWANIPRLRTNGTDGRVYAKYVIAHELGHLLGAEHVDSPTIMNPGVIEWADRLHDLNFDPDTVRQIGECLCDWGRK